MRTIVKQGDFMNRTFQYTIEPHYNNYTISAFLKEAGYPHAVLVHLKKTAEGILLNGKWEYVNTKLSAGDLLTIQLMAYLLKIMIA